MRANEQVMGGSAHLAKPSPPLSSSSDPLIQHEQARVEAKSPFNIRSL
jgi:hypothetical protein